MKDIKLLSYQKEKELSLDERITYYTELKEQLSKNKQTLSKKAYIALCEKISGGIKAILKILKGYELTIENADLIPDGPVIYASTHQDFYDHFNILIAIKSHSIILNNNKIAPLTKLALKCNGAVFVDRNDSSSRYISKVSLMEHIAKNKSVIVFPEGTYNCSPNRLILPIHSGVVDMARKMQIPIVPVAQEYLHDNSRMDGKNRVKSCVIRFGEPMYIKYEDDIKTKTNELRDNLATLRYDVMERKGIVNSTQITNEEYISYLLSRVRVFQKQGITYKEEEETIYGSDEEFYDFFPINALAYNENNELLPKKFM